MSLAVYTWLFPFNLLTSDPGQICTGIEYSPIYATGNDHLQVPVAKLFTEVLPHVEHKHTVPPGSEYTTSIIVTQGAHTH